MVPVCCVCGWTGWRTPKKITARPCPACDRQVKRHVLLEKAARDVEAILSRVLIEKAPEPTPLEAYIDETNAPVPRLPVPYVMRSFMGEVQIFNIPAHCRRRGRRRRR